MKARAWAEGKKSVAVAVRIQPRDATLTEAEIEAVCAEDRGGRGEAALRKVGASGNLQNR